MKLLIGALLVGLAFAVEAGNHQKSDTPHPEITAETLFAQLRGQYAGADAGVPTLAELNSDQSPLPLLRCVKKTWSSNPEGFKYQKLEGLMNHFKDVEQSGRARRVEVPGISVLLGEPGGAIGQMKLPELSALRKQHREQHAAHFKNGKGRGNLPPNLNSIVTMKNPAGESTDPEDARPSTLFERKTAADCVQPGATNKTQFLLRNVVVGDKPATLLKIVETYQSEANKPEEGRSITYCLRSLPSKS